MIAELGKYAGPVLWSYAATFALLGGIVWISWRQWRKVKAELDRIEGQGNGPH